MRGVHDMGGREAGRCERDEHEYERWEKRVDALMMLLSAKDRDLMKVDELRRNIESLGADRIEAIDDVAFGDDSAHRLTIHDGKRADSVRAEELDGPAEIGRAARAFNVNIVDCA